MPDETRTAATLPADQSTVSPPIARDAPTSPGSSSAPGSVPGNVGRYDLLEELARGGMGIVYRARDPMFARDVAVKLMHDGHRTSPAAVRRFTDEARITGQLQHPGIPPVFEVGALPDVSPFLAMKLIKGQTLDQLLKVRSDPSHERGRFVAIFEKVCEAVGYAHAHGVIHRDLKPANVMVGAFGEVQVMDWGLAKVLASGGRQPPGADPDATLGTEIRPARGPTDETQAGSLLGTPAYMPPEQAIGAVDQIDARSDVFGLGAILCAILTGKPPYLGADSESTRQLAARAKLDDAFERLDGCGAEPELAALCKRCLSVEKAARPADAEVVTAEVATFRSAAAERARLAELDRVRADGDRRVAETTASAERQRRRAQFALGSALLAVMLVGSILASWQWQRASRALADVTDEQGKTAAALQQVTAQQSETAKALGLVREEEKRKTAALAQAEAERARTLVALRKMTNEIVPNKLQGGEVLSEEGRQYLREVEQLWNEFARSGGDSVQSRALRGEALARVGSVRCRLGDLREGERFLREAIALFEGLKVDEPTQPDHRFQLALAHRGLGIAMGDTGRPAVVEAELRAALAEFQRLAAEDPARADRAANHAEAELLLGYHLARTLQIAQAQPHFLSAQRLYEGLAGAHPAEPTYQEGLGRALMAKMSVYNFQPRNPEGERTIRQAINIFAQLRLNHPLVHNYWFLHLTAKAGLAAHLLMNSGREEEADTILRDAVTQLSRLVGENPSVFTYRETLVGVLSTHRVVLEKLKKATAARDTVVESISHLRVLLRLKPGHTLLRLQYQINLQFLLAQQVVSADHRGIHERVGELVEFGASSQEVASLLAKVKLASKPPEGIEKKLPPDVRVAAARLLARCVKMVEADSKLTPGKKAELVDLYSTQAAVYLRQAVEKGMADHGQIQGDDNLASIRSHPAFRQLLDDSASGTAPHEIAPTPRPVKLPK